MLNKLKKINYPLLLGAIIVIYLLMMSLYPQKFTVNDPVYEESPRYIEVTIDGEKKDKLMSNPLPPNETNIFGTDDAGRDVYARLVYGTKNTMKLALLVVLFRLLLALPLGISAGMGSKVASGFIKIFNTFFTAIPMLIFSLIILNIGYFKSMQIDQSIIAFAVVLTIVGWAKLAGILEDSTKLVMDEDFIEGEIAIGKTKGQIAFQNIIPHIVPGAVSLFFKEMGLALFLIAQLSVFNVFVGVTRQISQMAFRGNYLMNLEPEWGGSLSRISQNIKGFENTYWMVVFPVLAFTIAITGLNLFGEGLRIEFQKKNSRIISSIKKLTYALSPKVFMSQVKNIKTYYKPVLVKVTAVILIMVYFAIPWHPSKYEFNLAGAKIHLDELSSLKYEGRGAGTEGGKKAGDYIIQQLKDYGYEVSVQEIPLKCEPSINPFTGSIKINSPDVLVPMTIEEGWITITTAEGLEKIYNLNKDFTVATISESIYSQDPGQELHYKGVAAYAEKASQINEGEDFFYISPNLRGFSGFGTGEANKVDTGKGTSREFQVMFMMDEKYDSLHNPGLYKFTSIIPFGDLKKELEKGFVNIEISLNYPKAAEYSGRNIIAFLPGKDKTAEEPGKVVIIGASYDGVYVKDGENAYAMSAAPAATALELAKSISELDEPLDKSVQFMFWDNDYDKLKFGMKSGSYYYAIQDGKGIDMALQHGYYYFDISFPGYKEDKKMNLITLPAQMADSNNYLMGMEIQQRLRDMNVDFKRFFYNYETSKGVFNMRTNALTTVGIGNPSTWGINSQEDTLENINVKRMEDMGQLILDTLTMNKYMLKLE